MSKSSRTNEVVYEFVCKNPGMCTYDMQKKLDMSGGRIRHALTRLHQIGLISFRWVRSNPHTQKLSYAVPAVKLLPRKLLHEIKTFRV